jgi:hypothetical protein
MYQAWLKQLSAFQEQAQRSQGSALPPLLNPQETWQQWTEGMTQAWQNGHAAQEPKETAAMAPYALYQAWLKTNYADDDAPGVWRADLPAPPRAVNLDQ